jgi:hypothetical protein
MQEVAARHWHSYREDMISGKPRPKISWSSRRIRLGVAHHGAPSTWTAPVKDHSHTRPIKKPRS